MSRLEEIADGVYRLGTEWVNWYLCAAGDAVVAIDSGFRAYRRQLSAALAELGRPALAAVVLTHYHPDHAGAAAALRAGTGAAILAPAGDAGGLRRGRVPIPQGLIASTWRPAMARYAAHLVANGGARRVRIEPLGDYADGELLGLPVRLRAIATPGHTAGHCALLAEDRGVLFTGDALANVDFFTRTEGVRLLPFHEDAAAATQALRRIEGVEAAVVAFGHGQPHHGSPADAVARARARPGG